MVPMLMYQVPGEGGWGMLILGWSMYLSAPALVIAFGIFVIGAYERRKMLALANGFVLLIGLGQVMFYFYKASEAERAGEDLGEYVRKKYSVTKRNSENNQSGQ